MYWLGRGIRALVRGCFRFAFFAALALAAYGWHLVQQLDISRENLLARARSVETSIVPQQVAGSGGRAFDAALEIPLSLPPVRIPDFVAAAFITQEDQQFRWHPGVNPLSLVRAARNYAERLSGRPAPLVGGSTITMQLVKNLLLNQSRTLDRKLREMVLAVIVEGLLTKDEILALYLNTAYFGDGAYGIEVAARKFFGRSVGYSPKIDVFEAAMLARSVQRPSRLNPSKDRKVLEAKARQLLTAMTEQGFVVPEAKRRPRGDRQWRLSPQLFRDVSMRFMMPAEIRGRDDALVTGLTIDTEAQLYAELAATDLLKRGRAAGYDSSAILVLQPDGAVIALATGHDYDGVDLVRDGSVSPGSTLKPFMFLCALEKGLRPDSLVTDEKREFRPDWTPRNFDGRYLGAITLDVALRKSRNTSAVELFDRFGPPCFADVLGRFGIALSNPRTPTSVLGSEHVSLLKLAGAYATLANGGARVEPYAVRYARETNGPILYRHIRSAPQRPASEGRPYCDLLGMLRSATRAGGTGHNAAFSHPVYGKTGTSQGFRDALFAGFTGHYVAVVWLGRQARGNPTGRITGGELPAESFRWLMATLHEGKEPIALDCKPPVRVAGRIGL